MMVSSYFALFITAIDVVLILKFQNPLKVAFLHQEIAWGQLTSTSGSSKHDS